MDVSVNKFAKLVCVEYPGIVKNPEKMLDTLGGEINISKTYNDPSRRLEIRFRPTDVYAKPACGDRFTATSVLLRIRRRKTRSAEQTTEQPAEKGYVGSDGYDYQANVVGIIDFAYKFNGMADFQYLPMKKTAEGQYTSLRDKLILSRLENRDWLGKEAPLFLPPPIFSRLDLPLDYAYRDGPKHGPNPTIDNRPPNIIGVARQRRPQYTLFAMFDEEKVPAAPYEEALQKVKLKMKDLSKQEYLQAVFQERPVWSKNALKYHTKLTSDQLKCLLPTVAYYFVTGPWRTLWVRLGYDPRADPINKQYQLLDFRVRQKTAAERLKINTKRSTYRYNLPNTVQKTSSAVAVIKADTFNIDWSIHEKTDMPDHEEATWRFRPGFVPPFRQMFYQFCDIEEPDIQKLVQANDGKEDRCLEVDGWCLPETQKQARNILYSHLKEFINRDIQPIDHSLPERSRRSGKRVTSKTTTAAAKEVAVDSDVDSDLDSGGDELPEDVTYPEDGPDAEDDENEMETEMLEHLIPEAADLPPDQMAASGL